MSGYAITTPTPYTGAGAKTLPVFPRPLLSPKFTHWWDAKRIPLEDGDTVSTWDNELVGKPALQAVTGKGPTLKRLPSGKPVVEFDGVDDVLMAGMTDWEETPHTLFVVGRILGDVTAAMALVSNRLTSSTALEILGVAGVARTPRLHVNGLSLDDNAAPVPVDEWRVWSATVANGATSLGVNERVLNGSTQNLITNSTHEFVLARYSTVFTRCQIASVAYAPQVLTLAEREAEVANLREIHGI